MSQKKQPQRGNLPLNKNSNDNDTEVQLYAKHVKFLVSQLNCTKSASHCCRPDHWLYSGPVGNQLLFQYSNHKGHSSMCTFFNPIIHGSINAPQCTDRICSEVQIWGEELTGGCVPGAFIHWPNNKLWANNIRPHKLCHTSYCWLWRRQPSGGVVNHIITQFRPLNEPHSHTTNLHTQRITNKIQGRWRGVPRAHRRTLLWGAWMNERISCRNREFWPYNITLSNSHTQQCTHLITGTRPLLTPGDDYERTRIIFPGSTSQDGAQFDGDSPTI